MDANSRPNLMGVVTGPIYYPVPPPVLPSFFFTAVIKPIRQAFEFDVFFNGPGGVNILKMDVKYTAETMPKSANRLIISGQIPPIPFPGSGQYSIVMAHDGRTVHSDVFEILIGAPEKPTVKIDVTASVNESFIGKSQ